MDLKYSWSSKSVQSLRHSGVSVVPTSGQAMAGEWLKPRNLVLNLSTQGHLLSDTKAGERAQQGKVPATIPDNQVWSWDSYNKRREHTHKRCSFTSRGIWWQSVTQFENGGSGAGEKARQLREFAALLKDKCLLPSTHLRWLSILWENKRNNAPGQV